ncbi:hypothetical protein RRG08_056985 [Elysia crispata]|uniref:Uncharacterized protein n=1 Tax=Elysia crispata TaxID=231223 RepID=A0AAE1DAQ0_9GAST|nr:hypothetical protein RRG08_056985 [Elysia crispata]
MVLRIKRAQSEGTKRVNVIFSFNSSNLSTTLTEQRDKLIGQLVRTSINRATRQIDWSQPTLTEQRDKLIEPALLEQRDKLIGQNQHYQSNTTN